jgi:nitrate reductase beta subunit
VGRIRSVGVLLYDADRIEDTAKEPEDGLVEAMREIVLDPNDPKVIDAARKNGVDDNWLAAAKESPAYNLFKKWRIAMPHHPEYRTLPMNFYVPPLSPILHMSKGDEGGTYDPESMEFFNDVDKMRIPLKYLANLMSAGNESVVLESLKKQMALRMHIRQKRVGDVGEPKVKSALDGAGLSAQDADEIYTLVSLATFKERFVIPETHRESKTTLDPREMFEKRGTIGFGSKKKEFVGREW